MDTEVKTIEKAPTPGSAPASNAPAEVKKTARPRKSFSFPALLTVSPSPHMAGPENTTTIMLDVIIALLPAYIWGVYVFGLRALWIGLISVGAAVGFEAITQFILHRPITVVDLSAVVTGLLLAMCLPVTLPLWMPVVGAFFAIVVVKQIFGGIGKNVVNPALAARVFLFSWALEMTAFQEAGHTLSSVAVTLDSADIVAGATPLAALKAGALPAESLFDMIIGNVGGCIGEVSALLLLAGGLYLIVFRKVITWHIPVSYLGTVVLLTLLFPRHGGVAIEFMLCQLLAGGLIMGAFFMATDYTTSPVTPVGRLIYGAGCGVITVLIRYFGSYPEGVSFAILIMNLLVWYLDKFTMPRRFGGKIHETK